MIATEYTLKLFRVTSEYIGDRVLYGSHGIESTVNARAIIADGAPIQIADIVKELGNRIVKELQTEMSTTP